MTIGSLAPSAWRALQELCVSLASRADVLWAGIAEATLRPRWVAFAGRDIDVPQPPTEGQGFRELDDVPEGTRIAYLTPSMPRRAYACAFVEGVALTLVIVPRPSRPSRPDTVELIARQLGSLLEPLRNLAPPNAAQPRFRLRPPDHFGAVHGIDWLSIPGVAGSRSN